MYGRDHQHLSVKGLPSPELSKICFYHNQIAMGLPQSDITIDKMIAVTPNPLPKPKAEEEEPNIWHKKIFYNNI
jgi:hypothetical protein